MFENDVLLKFQLVHLYDILKYFQSEFDPNELICD